MDCNGKSIEPRRRAETAFTLMETLIAIGIFSLILVALMQVVFYTGRSFAGLMNYIELDRYSRNALDEMIYKIRQADELRSFTSNRMVFTYMRTNALVYEYSANDRSLTETIDGESKTLLLGCDYLRFSIFQRTTAAGTYDQFPVTLTNKDTKVVQMTWSCSRTVLGGRVNTESMQSAKVVIRNK